MSTAASLSLKMLQGKQDSQPPQRVSSANLSVVSGFVIRTVAVLPSVHFVLNWQVENMVCHQNGQRPPISTLCVKLASKEYGLLSEWSKTTHQYLCFKLAGKE